MINQKILLRIKRYAQKVKDNIQNKKTIKKLRELRLKSLEKNMSYLKKKYWD